MTPQMKAAKWFAIAASDCASSRYEAAEISARIAHKALCEAKKKSQAEIRVADAPATDE